MISVCVATYNGEKYIRRQLLSILDQLSEKDEVIVSDDGSSDSTWDIIKSIGDKRITLIRNATGHGVNNNFSNALNHAQGEYIFLSDQDDVWLPGKVNKCIAELNDAVLVIHDAIITDYSLTPQNKTLFSELNIKEGFIPNLIRNRFTGCCMAFRREALDYILPIPSTTSFFHDNWIGLMCELKDKVKFIPYPGIYFRRHAGTNSLVAKGKSLSILKKIRSRLILITIILKRIIKI